MASADPHTVKAFDDDLERIRAEIAEMGGLTEAAIAGAIEALARHDELSATLIVAGDTRIDQMASEVERQCVRLIALRSPMADDLREVLAAFKIAILVERMGDCARSIAEQVPLIKGFERRLPLRLLEDMSKAAAEMVRLALDAFVKKDPAIAGQVCDSDDVVDALHDQLFRELLDIMSENPSKIGSATGLLLASQKLERIGDHASNIARVIFFWITGDHMPARPQQRAG